MSFLSNIFSWLFVRVPKKFSIPFLASLLLNAFLATVIMKGIDDDLPGKGLFSRGGILHVIVLTLSAFVLLFLIIAISYVMGWMFFKLLRRRMPLKNIQTHPPKLPDFSPAQDAGRLERYNSIGIILAGGGAKGAYQAGAMKAIYEFINHNKAHHKVKLIAGTSIGAWNALFWLANLIDNPNGDKGLLEKWWSNVGVEDLIDPVLYWPFQQNYLLSNQPWKESFKRFFIENKEAYDRLLHHIQNPNTEETMRFYFTRTNVERARLEFVTNVAKFQNTGDEFLHASSLEELRSMRKIVASVEALGTAVFSSMDIPPLFKYTNIDDNYYEDGGVIDNLPVRFGTDVEKCDLLFILPLNASFAEKPDFRSLTRRVLRVMNVRQGVLERNALKRVYRRNELTALRNELIDLRNQAKKAEKYEMLLEELQDQTEKLSLQFGDAIVPLKRILDESDLPMSKGSRATDNYRKDGTDVSRVEKLVQHRQNKVQVFAVCPAARLTINTSEFWKTEEAGRAFRKMYERTSVLLEDFDFSADHDKIRIAHVDPEGEILWSDYI